MKYLHILLVLLWSLLLLFSCANSNSAKNTVAVRDVPCRAVKDTVLSAIDFINYVAPHREGDNINARLHNFTHEKLLDRNNYGSFRMTVLEYESTDTDGNPVKLSEMVVYPLNTTLRKVFLDNHYTVTSNMEAPTGKYYHFPLSAAGLGYLTVSPDYLGYGISSDRTHPYICNKVIAANCVDGVFAALKYVKQIDAESLGSHLQLYNFGYSQGGTVAMAVQRYIENVCDKAEQDSLGLCESYCGAGVYDMGDSYSFDIQQDSLTYPCVVPMLYLGIKEGYKKEMKGLDEQDYFTPEFLSSGIMDSIKSKTVTTDRLNNLFMKCLHTTRMTKFMTREALNPQSKAYKTMVKCLADNNLYKGWTPKVPMLLFHSQDDDIVAYRNAENAVKGLGRNVRLAGDYKGYVHLQFSPLCYLEVWKRLAEK